MKSSDVRRKFIEFYKARGHVEIPSAPLVPENDPTTLFTSSGMQPLIPYLLGQPHPSGKRLVNSQKSFRAQDIDEVGDNRHTTFFEMLGNWSLGDYFKKEQLPWIWDFLTRELGLDPKKLYISVFEGTKDVPRDDESLQIWKNLGVPEERIFFYGVKKNWWSRSGEPEKMPEGEPGGPDSEVFYDFGPELKLHEKSTYKNEKCHPNCDCGRFLEIANSVFMQYIKREKGKSNLPALLRKALQAGKEKDEGNNYILDELSQKNVDFGGGLERLVAATENTPDVFSTDLFTPLIRVLEMTSGKQYGKDDTETKAMRIIADHMKGAVMMMVDGVMPSNKTQGYILRRLIRRSLLYGRKLDLENNSRFITLFVEPITLIYSQAYPSVLQKAGEIKNILEEESRRFDRAITNAVSLMVKDVVHLKDAINFINKNRFIKNVSLLITKDGVINTFLIDEQRNKLKELIHIATESGMTASFLAEDQLKEIINLSSQNKKRFNEIMDYFSKNKITFNSKWTFRFVSSFGAPLDILEELAKQEDIALDISEIEELKKKHQELSRTSAKGMFKGGLADASEEVTKLHTATHLLHEALHRILGDHVEQKGSNITSERLRFDFSHPAKLTTEEIKAIEELVNQKIQENLPVSFEIMDKEAALKSGARAFFSERYGEKVKVYTIGDPSRSFDKTQGERLKTPFSQEICGGPHVSFTGEVGHFTIVKEESAGAGIRRLYASISHHESSQERPKHL